MARLWTAGFESQHFFSEGLSAQSAGTLTYDTTNVRYAGTRASAKYDSTSTPALIYHTLTQATTNGRYYYFRAYIRLSGATGESNVPIFNFLSTTPANVLQVRLNASNQLQLYNSTGSANIGSASAALSATTWYRVEVGVRIVGSGSANCYAELKIDGNTIASSTTLSLGTVALGSVQMGWVTAAAASHQIWLDDCALNDNQTGGTQTSWCGEGKVWLMLPTADNARGANWYCGAAATTGLYDALNNTPPVGLASASKTATSQIYNATASSTDPASKYDATMQTYTAVGIPASDVIALAQLRVCAGNGSASSARAMNAYILSNPAESAPSTFNTPAATDGTFNSGASAPVGWSSTVRTLLYAPTVTRGTAPVVTLHREYASVANSLEFCFAGIVVESEYPTTTENAVGRIKLVSPDIETSTNALATAYSPNQLVAVAANGDVLAFWYDGNNVRWGYSTVPNLAWTTASLITGISGQWQSGIYKLSNDNVLLVTSNAAGNMVSYLFTYTAASHSWAAGGAVTVLSGGGAYNGGSVAMDVDVQGRIWAGWVDNSNVGQLYYTANNGTSWNLSTTLSGFNTGIQPTVALAYIGNYIVFIANASATSLFQYARVDASGSVIGSWSSLAAITNTALDNTTVSVSLRGVPGSGYGIFAGSGGTLPVQRYTASTNTWSAVTNIGAANDKNATLIDDGTNLYCVWCKYSAANNFSLVYKKWVASTNTWDSSTTELIASGNNLAWPNGGYGNSTLFLLYTKGTVSPWTISTKSITFGGGTHTGNAKGRLDVVLQTTKNAVGRIRFFPQTTKNSAGRAKIVVQSTKNGVGRVRVGLRHIYNGVGRARVVIQSVKNGAGRVKSTAQRVRNGAGRVRVVLVTVKNGSGRVRLLVQVTKNSTGRTKVAVRVTKNTSGRAKATIQVSRNSVGRIRVVLVTTKNAASRIYVSSVITRNSMGRVKLVTTANTTTRNGVGRVKTTAATVRNTTARIRFFPQTVKNTSGRVKITAQHVLNATGRSRVVLVTVRNGKGRTTVAIVTAKQTVARIRFYPQTIKNAKGRTRVVLTSTKNAAGRSFVAVRVIKNAAGHIRTFPQTTKNAVARIRFYPQTIKQATGRAAVKAQITKNALGRVRAVSQIVRNVSGRSRVAVLVHANAMGRMRTFPQTIKNATARVKVGLRRRYAGRVYVTAGIVHTRNAVGRMKLLATHTANSMGRVWVARSTTKNGSGRTKLSALHVYNAKARIQVVRVTTKNAAGRSRVALGTAKNSAGRVRVVLVAIRNGKGRVVVSLVHTVNALGRVRIKALTERRASGRVGMRVAHTWNMMGRAVVRGLAKRHTSGRATVAQKHIYNSAARLTFTARATKQATGRFRIRALTVYHVVGRVRVIIQGQVAYSTRGRVKITARAKQQGVGRMVLIVGQVDVVFTLAEQAVEWSVAEQDAIYKVGYNDNSWDVPENTTVFRIAENKGE
jgi:hypothetical protein